MASLTYSQGQNVKLTQIETATPLTGAAAYTSQWVDVSQYEALIFAAKADAAGTLYAQFSPTGTEGDAATVPSQLTYQVAANTNEVHRLLKTRQFFRLRYVNGSVAQTSFHIQCFAGNGGLLTSVVGGTIQQDQDAVVARLIPPVIDISAGLFQGYTTLVKFGRNSVIDTTSDPEDVWDGGGLYTGHPTATLEVVEVLSSSANDTNDSGSGARTVRIIGLDENFVEQEETITLAGQTPVDSTGTYSRIFRAYVVTAGATGANEGTITIRHTTTTANVFSVMAIGKNQSSISAYTVPAGKTLYIQGLSARMSRANNGAGSATITFRTRALGEVYRTRIEADITNGVPFALTFLNQSLICEEKTDILFRVDEVGSSGTAVSSEMVGILVETT